MGLRGQGPRMTRAAGANLHTPADLSVQAPPLPLGCFTSCTSPSKTNSSSAGNAALLGSHVAGVSIHLLRACIGCVIAIVCLVEHRLRHSFGDGARKAPCDTCCLALLGSRLPGLEEELREEPKV